MRLPPAANAPVRNDELAQRRRGWAGGRARRGRHGASRAAADAALLRRLDLLALHLDAEERRLLLRARQVGRVLEQLEVDAAARARLAWLGLGIGFRFGFGFGLGFGFGFGLGLGLGLGLALTLTQP